MEKAALFSSVTPMLLAVQASSHARAESMAEISHIMCL